ncbi:unnamed protein product [Trichogramma brassicae]|uniref:Uncharacterized protein n=1 Tax=Trichogramma brassicae TaxID=86971 RepID=A0A6H5J468_9HYME|nr:unnamed protein product [Trichogramma brassicae]
MYYNIPKARQDRYTRTHMHSYTVGSGIYAIRTRHPSCTFKKKTKKKKKAHIPSARTVFSKSTSRTYECRAASSFLASYSQCARGWRGLQRWRRF